MSSICVTAQISRNIAFGHPFECSHASDISSGVFARNRAQVHHLTFAQPNALGRKVSDEFTVPLCSTHHRELHYVGNEKAWWEEKGIEPMKIAEGLWEDSEVEPIKT